MAEAAQAMLLKPVVYCDQQKQPIVLPALPAPASVSAFAQTLEQQTGQKAQLLSYWNYAHKRYDALLSMDQLRQDEALLVRGSHEDASNNNNNTALASTTTTTPMYRAQMWLETTWLSTSEVDPAKDRGEFAELERHVRRCGRGGSGSAEAQYYRLEKAVRVHYTYLARRFDETRQARLHGYQNRIKLLYYTGNAWGVGQVLEHGFVMRAELPTTACPLTAGHNTEVSALLAATHVAPAAAVETAATTTTTPSSLGTEADPPRLPFLFSSFPSPIASTAAEAAGRRCNVLLCEVAPGRQWLSEHPLQTDAIDAKAAQGQSPPEGYDSVVYEERSESEEVQRRTGEHRRHRSGSTASSHAVPRLPPSLLQVQTSMSYQALPRYLLTLEATSAPAKVTGARSLAATVATAGDRAELAQSTPLRRHASRPRSVHSAHVRRSRSYTNAPATTSNMDDAAHERHHVRRAGSATLRERAVQARAVHLDAEQQRQPMPQQHVQVVRPAAAPGNAATGVRPAARPAQTLVPAAAMRAGNTNTAVPVYKPPPMPTMAPSVPARPAGMVQQPRVVPHVQPQPQVMLETSATPMRERLVAPAVLQCALHPRRMTTLYCATCGELICPYCASVGTHQGHVIRAADEQAAQMQGVVQEVCHELREGQEHVERVERQLTLERADAVQRQGRRVQSLRLLLNEVRRAIDERESILTRQLATQEAGLQPPVEAIAQVRATYAEVLQPLEETLKDYFAALQRVTAAPPLTTSGDAVRGSERDATDTMNAAAWHVDEGAGGSSNVYGSDAAAHQARVALLLFLRTAPHLLEQARTFLRQRAEENVEGKLRDAIASVRDANKRAEQMLAQIKVSELRRQIELLGSQTSSSAAAAAASATRPHRAALLTSSASALNASLDGANETENVPRLLRRSSMKSLASNSAAQLAMSPGQRAAVEEMRTLSGLERCLVDLQRGFIWTIQDATKLFAPGQTRTVCSTPFQLLRSTWELRIAALPRSDLADDPSLHYNGSVHQGRQGGERGAGARSVNDTAHLSDLSATNGEEGSTSTLSPALATAQPFAAGRGVSLSAIQTSAAANGNASDEAQWLGLFLCPKEHGMRMDFRLIAFSEVVWREWNVTGWSEAFIGKGWGLYPFLRRKDLMRTDKLARDNTVKLCITPISELY